MVQVAGALIVKMVIAAFSGMGAATFCHPLDVIRVQMQTEGAEYKSPVDCAKQIVERSGVKDGLYAGISAAYLRQWLYGSCRIGIYAFLLEQEQAKLGKDVAIPFVRKLAMGMTSGGIGSFVGTPSELALVRMSNDSKLPEAQRRNYKNIGNCLARIFREEGLTSLWTGARVTVLRAMVLSAFALGLTSEIKSKLIVTGFFGENGQMFQGIPLLFIATMFSSFVANIASNPFDVVKSRVQNQGKTGDKGQAQYDGMIDCFLQIVRKEGVHKLWAGFVPAFVKLAPYTVISLTLADKITKAVTGKAAL